MNVLVPVRGTVFWRLRENGWWKITTGANGSPFQHSSLQHLRQLAGFEAVSSFILTALFIVGMMEIMPHGSRQGKLYFSSEVLRVLVGEFFLEDLLATTCEDAARAHEVIPTVSQMSSRVLVSPDSRPQPQKPADSYILPSFGFVFPQQWNIGCVFSIHDGNRKENRVVLASPCRRSCLISYWFPQILRGNSGTCTTRFDTEELNKLQVMNVQRGLKKSVQLLFFYTLLFRCENVVFCDKDACYLWN